MASTYPAYGHAAPDTYPYPPATTFNANTSTSSTIFNANAKDPDDIRHQQMRTPSPTPSEDAALKSGIFDWKSLKSWRFWIRKEWTLYYIIFIVIVTLTTLITVFHKDIVKWLTPVANWLHDLSFGWLVPIGILFVISFPPLFGHEIVAVLCGLVWGLWIGFGIVAAGTFLGEVGNFYAFKYCCRARGAKLERTKISYACLARVVREGGFKIALVARFSAIPGHFTTAVFSTCGMGIITFSIAAILSLPKQFVTVYLGVILDSTGPTDTKSKLLSDAVVGITFLVTIGAMWYIYHQMNLVKPAVIHDRRKARQAKLARGDFSGGFAYRNPDATSSDNSVTFNPRMSDSDIPLTAGLSGYQQWDKEGRAVGYSGDPRLNIYSPQPLKKGASAVAVGRRVPIDRTAYLAGTGVIGRDEEEGYSRPSTDEVGWDMSSGSRSTGTNPFEDSHLTHHGPATGQPRPSFASDETVNESAYGGYRPSSAPRQQSQPRPHPPQQQRPPPLQSPGPIPRSTTTPVSQVRTPTQAQYVTMSQPQPGSTSVSPALPTPSYPTSPFDDPVPAQHIGATSRSYYTESAHTQEPTDASYHTASSSHSQQSSEAPTPRVLSPPPPSYSANIR